MRENRRFDGGRILDKQMVIMKNNFGVEPDVDSVVVNATEGSANDSKASGAGHPKAILICRRNSHPFQARTLILNTPAKIGRSVARARPSSNNGIFDCKVLSRNHAIIWYEYDSGKFMIQDTKSSNGTYVNNQRLSKGGETSLPREFFSRDFLQFGVDVLENQRKGNEESENSDESNHIVTHGCIMATVRLFHPNGKESKSGQPYSPPTPTNVSQEKICKLELIIHEALQREERLHYKLGELQFVINKLKVACEEGLTIRFEETRLLSKIESLEKQTKVMSKLMSRGNEKSEKVESEIQQLLVDIENVQCVARQIQERQLRKLLESQQKLVEAQRVASNLELEVIALREQASLTESQLQYMGTKCSAYFQKIETFKSNFYTQLEAQVAKFVEREVERELNETNLSDANVRDKYKFILDESEKKGKEGQEVILEWCKNYEELNKIEEKDLNNEDDKAGWFTKKLESLSDTMCGGLDHISNCIGQLLNSIEEVEKSRKNLEKLCKKKHELAFQLETAKMPVVENEKTEDELDGDKNELVKNTLILSPLSNEKITELESDLKEQEELLSQARVSHEDLETKCSKLKYELDATIKHCKKLNSDSGNLRELLEKHLKYLEDATSEYKDKVVKLESEMSEPDNGKGVKIEEVAESRKKTVEAKETQTSSAVLISSSTNTEVETKPEVVEELTLKSSTGDSCSSGVVADVETSAVPDAPAVEKSVQELSNLVNFTEGKSKPETEWTAENLGIWEKMQKIQRLLSYRPTDESSLSDGEFVEMKNLMNLIAEDLVHLLLREQQMSKDKQSLQEKLDKSLSGKEISHFGLAIHLKSVLLFLVTAVIAYFLYSIIS